MEFIRWVILSWEDALFCKGLILPVVFLNLFIGGFLFIVNVILGSIMAAISLVFWGTVAYVFISRSVKAFYAKYEKEKARESKTS